MYIKIDTTGIKKATANAACATEEGRKIALLTQLATFKTKTIPILGKNRPLSKDDKAKATEIAKKLYAGGWLTEFDKDWCSKQGIEI